MKIKNKPEVKYVVCYSGGHSSALVAVEAVRKVGKENVILLNHDISSQVEHEDIKRFKREVSNYLGIEITQANMPDFENNTPLKISMKCNSFASRTGTVLCTSQLKTQPFHKWLNQNYPVTNGEVREDIEILYGFDKNEETRIQRRIGVMALKGYRTDYPLARWDRTIESIEEIGIKRPITYELFRHANCIGCLKSGRQQWYIVYCLYPEIWKQAKEVEDKTGYTIIKNINLEELEPKFTRMKCKGIIPSEKMKPQTFWAMVRKELGSDSDIMPCECSF